MMSFIMRLLLIVPLTIIRLGRISILSPFMGWQAGTCQPRCLVTHSFFRLGLGLRLRLGWIQFRQDRICKCQEVIDVHVPVLIKV